MSIAESQKLPNANRADAVYNKSPHLPAGYYTPWEGFKATLHPRGKTAGYSERCGDKLKIIKK